MKESNFYEKVCNTRQVTRSWAILREIARRLVGVLPIAIVTVWGMLVTSRTFKDEMSARGARAVSITGLVLGLVIVLFVICLASLYAGNGKWRRGGKLDGTAVREEAIRLGWVLVPFILLFALAVGYSRDLTGLASLARDKNIITYYKVAEPMLVVFLAFYSSFLIGAVFYRYAFRLCRQGGFGLESHFFGGKAILEKRCKEIKGLIGGEETLKSVIVEAYGASLYADVFLLLCASVYVSLALIVAQSSMTAAGEWFILTANKFLLLFLMSTALWRPKLRWGGRLGALPLIGVLPILYIINPASSMEDLTFYGLAAVLAVLVGRLIYKDLRSFGKRRCLVITDQRFYLVEPGAGDALMVQAVTGSDRPKIEETFAAYHMHLPVKGGEVEPFRILTRPELEHAAAQGPESCRDLAAPMPLVKRPLRSRPVLALAAHFFGCVWLYYALIGYGLALGLLTIVEVANWTQGKSENMYRYSKLQIRYFPMGAVGYTFGAMSAADTERFDEAIALYEMAGKLSRGLGSAGSLVKEGRISNFVDFCRLASALKRETKALAPPAGTPAAAYRELVFARRYLALVQSHKSQKIHLAWPRVILRHLRKAAVDGSPAYPEASFAYARALARFGVYRPIEKAYSMYARDEKWNAEALTHLERLKGKIPEMKRRAVIEHVRDSMRKDAKRKADMKARRIARRKKHAARTSACKHKKESKKPSAK